MARQPPRRLAQPLLSRSAVFTILGWSPGVRTLRSGRVLRCGCLTGTYETRRGATIVLVDGRGAACPHPYHRLDATLGGEAPELQSSFEMSVGDPA